MKYWTHLSPNIKATITLITIMFVFIMGLVSDTFAICAIGVFGVSFSGLLIVWIWLNIRELYS